jgi:hypothetical protein
MRKSFILLFTLISITATAQKPDKLKELQESIAKHRAELDSMQKANDSLFAVRMKRSDSAEMARFNEQNASNLNSFVRNMKERERKQKQAMWMRIGAGLLFLAIGIYGVTRKRKPKTGGTGS